MGAWSHMIAAATAAAAGPLPPYKTESEPFVVTSFDQVKLPARVVYPKAVWPNDSARFPAIVMSNSWFVDSDLEYYAIQDRWAREGYVVVSYECRGWFGAGGQIGAAGPDDVRDHFAVMTSLEQHADKWHANMSSVGTAGVSYGGGLAAIVAAFDPRVKAVAALSGWGNLTTALYGGDTVSLIWGSILIDAGAADGRESKELIQHWHELLGHYDVAGVTAWSNIRSPLNYTEAMCGNGRALPVFISNNLEDRLFKGDAALYYHRAIKNAGCRSKVLLNQGIHATAEIPELLGLEGNSTVWWESLQWFNRWLKGTENGIDSSPEVRIQERRVGPTQLLRPAPYVDFSVWPPQQMDTMAFFFTAPKSQGNIGGLVPSRAGPSNNSTTVVRFGKHSGLNAGVPIIGEILQVFVDVPIQANLNRVDYRYAAAFVTAPFKVPGRICGTPSLRLQVSTEAPIALNATYFTVVGYLYDIPAGDSSATLISHGPQSEWGSPSSQDAKAGPYDIFIRMRSLCWNLKAGHSIGLGLTLFDPMYKSANEASDLQVQFHFGSTSTLTIPLVT